MGSGSSKTDVLDKEKLEEYATLTFLSKPQIIKLATKFEEMKKDDRDIYNYIQRVTFERISQEFPQIEHNPFKERLREVFSTYDGYPYYFSFEDMVDLFSVLSENCPSHVKATWAFRLYSFGEDDGVGVAQIGEIIKLLAKDAVADDKIKDIAEELIKEMDIEENGKIGSTAFAHGVGKMSEFKNAFTFNV